MKSILIALSLFGLVNCGGNVAQEAGRSADLVVTYQGEIVHKRSSRYITLNKLESLANQSKPFILIFAADWCKACKLTREAVAAANLKVDVYYANADHEWVQHLMAVMGTTGVPFMAHTSATGEIVSTQLGASRIVTYLLSNF